MLAAAANHEIEVAMGYNALEQMREKNLREYGVKDSVHIPPLPKTARNYGREALSFVRDCCENLNFDTVDPQRKALEDSDGCSSGPGKIPYNMERDIDRLSFEVAIGRFLATGSREDAFDIYYCYCEIFKPFGTGYGSTGRLLEMLAEHESNASSLLMKHRDHYSHSVYVFLIGIALYKNNAAIHQAYNKRFGLEEGPAAACHFLKYWGITSLFHDIGYPFEIAHQQMKAYVCKLDANNNDERGFAPYVSYRRTEDFALTRLGDLNALYARALTERMSLGYLQRVGVEPYVLQHKLLRMLKDRPVHANPDSMDYLYMDHAYFSGIMLAKAYLDNHRGITEYEMMPEAMLDSLCAIILHNSIFNHTMRELIFVSEPLSLDDQQPLSYLLFLCDELQCWDRTAYGQNTRANVYAFDFDMTFDDQDTHLTYYFDENYREKLPASKAYVNLGCDGYTKKGGATYEGRCKFADDINKILHLHDAFPAFQGNVNEPDNSGLFQRAIEKKARHRGLYLSDSNYFNLYKFALALNGRYCGAETQEEMEQAFENRLSLEYKLSNIAQAKGFGPHLEKIDCFYTDRAVDYEPVYSFSTTELATLAEIEHERWCGEKISMGWQYGTHHVGVLNGSNDGKMRERLRMHNDLVDFAALSDEDIYKDEAPMAKMLELIRLFDGLTIYRMWDHWHGAESAIKGRPHRVLETRVSDGSGPFRMPFAGGGAPISR